MKLSLAMLALVSGSTEVKVCTNNIMHGKTIHHRTYVETKAWPYLRSNGCGAGHQNCDQQKCAEACAASDACKAWTHGNRNRCYLLDEAHLKWVDTAFTNGAFDSAVCTTYRRTCTKNVMHGKTIHHRTHAETKAWPYLRSNGCGAGHQNCDQQKCAEACEASNACKAWTHGNRNRCYLLDEAHLKWVDTAFTNGAFDSAVCTEEALVDLDMEMDVPKDFDENKLKNDIAKALGVDPKDVQIGIKSESRRLIEAVVITVKIVVSASKEEAVKKASQTTKFVTKTGATVISITKNGGWVRKVHAPEKFNPVTGNEVFQYWGEPAKHASNTVWGEPVDGKDVLGDTYSRNSGFANDQVNFDTIDDEMYSATRESNARVLNNCEGLHGSASGVKHCLIGSKCGPCPIKTAFPTPAPTPAPTVPVPHKCVRTGKNGNIIEAVAFGWAGVGADNKYCILEQCQKCKNPSRRAAPYNDQEYCDLTPHSDMSESGNGACGKHQFTQQCEFVSCSYSPSKGMKVKTSQGTRSFGLFPETDKYITGDQHECRANKNSGAWTCDCKCASSPTKWGYTNGFSHQ